MFTKNSATRGCSRSEVYLSRSSVYRILETRGKLLITNIAETRNSQMYLSSFSLFRTTVVAQTVKNLPAVRESVIQSLGLQDPLEKGMATHSSILAWRIPWTEEPGGLQSMRSQCQTRLSD